MPARKAAKRPKRFSLTTMERAEGCLRSHYLDRLVGADGPQLVRGSIAHEVFDRLAVEAYNRRLTRWDEEEAVDRARELLRAPMEVRPLSLEHYTEVLDMVKGWARCMTFNPDADLFLVEHLVEVPLGGYTFSGKIDRLEVTGNVAIVDDYKTSPHIGDVAAHIQTPFYGHAVKQLLPHVQWFDLAEVYVRWGKRVTPKPDHSLVSWEELQAANIEDYMLASAARLDLSWSIYENDPKALDDAFPATGGEHCDRCPAAHLCPKPRGANARTRIRNDQEAEKGLRDVARLDAARGAITSGLRGYLNREEVTEPVVSGGKKALMKPSDGGWSVKKGKAGDVEAFVRAQGGEERVAELLSLRKPSTSLSITKA